MLFETSRDGALVVVARGEDGPHVVHDAVAHCVDVAVQHQGRIRVSRNHDQLSERDTTNESARLGPYGGAAAGACECIPCLLA